MDHHLFAGVPVSDLDASIDWYTRLFGRPPDRRVGHEMLWEMDEHAWLFIEPNATQAGAGRITLAVSGLDAFLEHVAVEGIEHEPIETYSNGVRHVKIPDPEERDRLRRAACRQMTELSIEPSANAQIDGWPRESIQRAGASTRITSSGRDLDSVLVLVAATGARCRSVGNGPKHALTGDAKRDDQYRRDHHRKAPHDPTESKASGRCRPVQCPVSCCVWLSWTPRRRRHTRALPPRAFRSRSATTPRRPRWRASSGSRPSRSPRLRNRHDRRPQCTYATGAGRREIKLLADDYKGSQPYFILDRTAEEAGQVFVPTRVVAPPVAINHIGLLAVWFPAREQLMATDGLKLITTTVTWKGVTQRHRLALAEAFTKPYIKVTKQGRAAAKLFP